MSTHDDERLSRWIAMTQAEADPALWTRVRQRVLDAEARPHATAWLEWLGRPAALLTATTALIATLGLGWVTLRDATESEITATSLTEALLDDNAALEVEIPDVPGDSGVAG